MKITQYITSETQSFAKREVFPSVYMSAAKTLTLQDEAVSNDFMGFGVAITGSSCYELNQMEPAARTALLKQIYTKEGIGLSVGRLSVGSSDYSAELYSYDDVADDVALEYFSIERDKAYIIPMIREILKIKPDLYLFASPWSPPGWMKTGGSLCGGYMRAEYIDCYAEYIVRYLREYEKCGIKISALTPQNEPETQQTGKMPSCIWHPDIEAKFISVLRQKLDANGMDVKIWMYDHNFNGADRVQWTLEQYPRLKEDCDGIAFHYYRGAIEQTLGLKAAYPELKMHFTEGGPRLYDNYSTDWCKWGIMMSKALNCGYASFTGWNLMLDENGDPNVGPFFCGGLVTKNSVTGELSYSGQYKAFQHIAKFVEPDATVLKTELTNYGESIFSFPKMKMPTTAAAVKNPDGRRVLFLANPDSEKCQLQFFLHGSWWYVELMPNSLSTVLIDE